MPYYVLSTCKEVTHEQMLDLQRSIDEYKSVMGSDGLLVAIFQEMLDQAEKVS